MASNYVSLEDAAKALGVPADRLVQMRSQGEIRGFRDGASWKFPQTEIDRLLAGSGINLSDEGDVGPGGSSILVSEPGSDVALVARQGDDGSDVQVVSNRSDDEPPQRAPLEEADDDELMLAGDNDLELADESGVLDLGIDAKEGSTGPVIGADDLLAAEEGGTGPESDLDLDRHGSDADVLGDLDLVGAEQGGTDDLIHGDSAPSAAGGDVDDALSDDDELVIADDDDDLVLSGAESDISIAGDSGVNLMSPSDSGLSLESEPLDLAGSSISALDLGTDAAASPSKGGSGSGSLVDFEADEEFQLSPSGVGIDAEDDSGSQVIEVEDSAAFVGDMDLGDDAFGGGTAVVGEGLLDGDAVVADEGLVAEDAMMDDGFGIDAGAPAPAGAAVPVAYETPFTTWSVVALAGILLLMCLGGMLMTDLMRNMWAYSEPAAPVSSMTDALISMFGLDG